MCCNRMLQGEHALQIVEVGTITETTRGEIFIEPYICTVEYILRFGSFQ
jgi:hypothetical protein